MKVCENCGEGISLEQYLSVDIISSAMCDTCKKSSKAQRKQRMLKSMEVQKDICTFNACKNNAYNGYDICKKHYKDGIND